MLPNQGRERDRAHPVESGHSSLLYYCFAFQSKKKMKLKQNPLLGFPGGAVVKNPPANAGDTGLSPGPGRSHMLQSN